MGSVEVMKVRLTADGITDVIAAMKRVQNEAKAVQGAGNQAGQALGNLGTLFAAQQLAQFVKHTIAASEALWDMAQKTGATVESLSVLVHMGGQAGVAADDLEKGLIKLAKSQDALQKGDSSAAEYFRRIGLSAKDLEGMKPDAALLRIAEAQGKFADGTGKAAVMLGIFGKSGANLIPLLNDMAEGGYRKNREELEKLGLVLSVDMAKNADDFKDSLDRAEKAAQGATMQIANSMLPGLTRSITALTAALAGTPAGVKAFTATVAAVGTVATAATVAVKTLYTAIAGLGPVGLAVVALSALVAVVISLKQAQEAAQAEAVKADEVQFNRVKRGQELVDQYAKESKLLAQGNLDARTRKEHEEKLKRLKEDLIKLGPDYAKVVGDETKSLEERAKAARAVNEADAEALENKKKAIRAEIERISTIRDEAAKRNATASTYQAPQIAGMGGMYTAGAATNASHMIQDNASAEVKALEAELAALEGRLKSEKKDEKPKKELTAPDYSALKARAAAETAAVRRATEAELQELKATQKDMDDLYAEGLLDLEAYYRQRRAEIERSTDLEARALRAQVDEVQKSMAAASTPADRIQASTRILDLEAQIQAKRRDQVAQGQELARKERDDRRSATEEAIRLEAQLAQAKGFTGEAGIRAIEAEYARRIQLSRTPEGRAALAGLRDAESTKARLGDREQEVDLKTRELNLKLEGVNNDRARGLITEAEAIQRKIEAYRDYIPVLEAAAQLQRLEAGRTGNPADLIRADENLAAVEALKGSLKGLDDQVDWVKTSLRDGLGSALEDFLMSLEDRTTSLTDKILALGRAIARAVMQAGINRFVNLAVDGLFQVGGGGSGPTPVKSAVGGYITGPGTSTSDSIPAWLSNGEYVLRAAAVQKYGLGLLNSLNGLRLPRDPHRQRFAAGGPVGGISPASPVFNHTSRIVNVLDPSLVESYMCTPAGEKAVLNVIAANPKTVRRIVE